MSKLRVLKRVCILFVFCTATAIATPGQTFTSLYSFAGTNGNEPNGLAQGTDGNLYGTTVVGGAGTCPETGCGTVFSITVGGTLTTLHSFFRAMVKTPTGRWFRTAMGDFMGQQPLGAPAGRAQSLALHQAEG